MDTPFREVEQATVAGEQSQEPRLTVTQILRWADTHYRATGCWPTRRTGWVRRTKSIVTWHTIDLAVICGTRSLGGGQSLDQLLHEHRGVMAGMSDGVAQAQPDLTVERILAWADTHFQSAGSWPTAAAGPVAGAPEHTWSWVNTMLREGGRGVPGGSTLARLLKQHGRAAGWPSQDGPPALTVDLLLSWADAYHQEHGKWPNTRSGAIPGTPAENWNNINQALWTGRKGLPARMSLARLLAENAEPAIEGDCPL